ncbi:MAG: hypothetical protein DRI57_03445 [Deltaproteobacteria bacterium]|nr:MAG: hypothetical protein DRI57_03445 [Deltaproteobacteria bacterium]
MPKISDIISFKRDLFFGGAVQISWFETDPERRDQAASNFVFHGPEYHGVSEEDIESPTAFPLVDTVRFTGEILNALNPETENKNPFALSIAGWGTGKSHLGLTLAALFSDTRSDVSDNILSNIEAADVQLGREIRDNLRSWEHPVLMLPINGMKDFDLASELNRQVLCQLKAYGLDTTPVEELTPRFKIAETFVERNFELRHQEFAGRFSPDITAEHILRQLKDRDDLAYRHVNEIFEIANGYPIRAMGQETPQQLIQTVCETYCGEDGPFQSLLILFDEFGRYLEFAAERPHIAGDAALQQLFEGVQDNSEHCFLLCFIQYELKAYLSRVSHEKRPAINRYIGRYDSARKFHLSTNLETLFAHLIQKKDESFLSDYLLSFDNEQEWHNIHTSVQKWFPDSAGHAVWRDAEIFRKVVVEGCWPLHPFATWFLCRLSDSGKELQQRSAISFIEEALIREYDRHLPETKKPWTVSATQLCLGTLTEELISSEEYGYRGAAAHAYIAAEQRYKDNLSDGERHTLLAVLIAVKIGLKIQNQEEAHQALSIFSDLSLTETQDAVQELTKEYGVLEWNERFQRYEIIGDAVPRSDFTAFLRRKSSKISTEQVEDIFAANMKNWAELQEIAPEFASLNDIRSVEWRFQVNCTHIGRIEIAVKNAIQDWKTAVGTDSYRGQLIYCYISPDSEAEEVQRAVRKILNNALANAECDTGMPLLIVMLHDAEGKLRQALSEYRVLNNDLSDEDKQRYTNFIKDHFVQLSEELKLLCEKMIQARMYVYPKAFKLESARLKKITLRLFEETYPKIVPFPFDGFSTARGNAAKDSREITVELFKGTLNDDWISSRKSKTQNRAVLVLRRSWGALGDDGEISWLPSNSRLLEIISFLEQSLKDEGELNLGSVFDMLIMPPYGCNKASAGLIIGVFLAPRKDAVGFLFNGEKTTPSVWMGKAFSGNYLKHKTLEATCIQYISESGTREWQDLLARWDMEETHSGRVSYMGQADALNKRIPISAGILHERFDRLNEDAKRSLAELSSLNNFLEKEDEYYFRAYQKEDVANLSRVGKDLNFRLEKMRREEDQWTPDQLELISPKIDEVKQAVIQFFDPWISQANQMIRKPQQIGDFRHRLEQVGGNLKALGLRDLSKRLERHVVKIISNIEELQKLAYIGDEARAFIDSHRITSHSRVAELSSWSKKCDELNRSLRKAKGVPDIDQLIEKVTDVKKSCKDQVKQHKKRATKLWEWTFSSLEDVRSAKVEVKILMDIFAGQEMDLEDLSSMDRQLAQFERDFSIWNDLNIPNEELKDMVANRIEEILNLQSQDEPPPWEDIREIYEKVLEKLLAQRLDAANQWIKGVQVSSGSISEMTAEDCQHLLNRIEKLPAYVDMEQSEQVNFMREKLEDRLDNLQVEGLLARFRQMSKPLRKQFLEMATTEFKS